MTSVQQNQKARQADAAAESSRPERPERGVLPDFEFIRTQIPIVEVARALGLRLVGRNRCHCWRIEHHKHGDRTPSMSFRSMKNDAKCFVCDDHPMSVLDLVKAHNGGTIMDAARWITTRFPVPLIPKNRKLSRPQRWHRSRAGVSGDPLLEDLIGSGLWAGMAHAEQTVFLVLRIFADEKGEVCISYRGIARYSGVNSNTTIASAIKRLARRGLLRKVFRAAADGFRATGAYVLTPDNPHLHELIAKGYARTNEAAAEEKTIRAERKKTIREEHKRRAHTTGIISVHRSGLGDNSTVHLSESWSEEGLLEVDADGAEPDAEGPVPGEWWFDSHPERRSEGGGAAGSAPDAALRQNARSGALRRRGRRKRDDSTLELELMPVPTSLQ